MLLGYEERKGGARTEDKVAYRILSQQRMANLLQINDQLVEVSRRGTSGHKELIDSYISAGEALNRLIIAEAKIQEATL